MPSGFAPLYTQLAFTSQEDGRVSGYRPFGRCTISRALWRTTPASRPGTTRLWIHDPDYGTNVRLQRDPELDPTVLGEVTEVLEEVNEYIPIYRTAREQMAASGAGNATLMA